jgi:hypothetical protein
MVACLLYATLFPETKGKSMLEIRQMFSEGDKKVKSKDEA